MHRACRSCTDYPCPARAWTRRPRAREGGASTGGVARAVIPARRAPVTNDNFDDNALAWFTQYASAPSSSPLRQRGISFGLAGDFEADARAGRLPQVSWLVAPTAQTEHPDYFPAAGAEYIAQKLDAIASNPDVWAKTAFILCYDENDGMFDHVPPPAPAPGTAAEFVDGEPIGLGF